MSTSKFLNKKVLFIIGGDVPHPFHAALAKSIHADFYKIAKRGQPNLVELIKSIKNLPKNYDIYLSETIFFVPTVAKIFRLIPKKALIVNIVADPVLYNMVNGYKNKLPNLINKVLLKKVDGFVFIGKWGYLLNQIGLNTPLKEIFGGVKINLIKELKRIQINKKRFENNHKIVFVGNINQSRAFYKGIDILINAIGIIRKQFPDTKLLITGNSKLDKKYPFVEFTGNINLNSVISQVSLAVFMGRGDSLPLGSVETMIAGTPTIVSTDTGAKEIVNKIDKDFICKLNVQDLANKMSHYFKRDVRSKMLLAKAFREEASKYTEKRAINNFNRKFLELVNEIKMRDV
jgi:glycosyltransferase involved in cell wall biosynthesis